MVAPRMTFGEALKKYRIENGLTQKELSDKLGHSTSQLISNLERSVAHPSVDMAIKIGKYVKLPMTLLHDIFLKKEVYNLNRKFKKYL